MSLGHKKHEQSGATTDECLGAGLNLGGRREWLSYSAILPLGPHDAGQLQRDRARVSTTAQRD